MYTNTLRSFIPLLIAALLTPLHGQDTPWEHIGPCMGYIHGMAQDEIHPDTLYAATPYGLFRTTDMAATWTKTGLDSTEITGVEVSLADPSVVVAFNDTLVFLSEDYGITWNVIGISDLTIGAVALDPEDSQSMWVGEHVSEWRVYQENLFHSTDRGASWDPVPFQAGEEMKLSTVLDIHIDRSDPEVIYVAGRGDTYHSDGGLFVSQDGGDTWTNHRPGGCSSNNVFSVATTPDWYEPHLAFILVDACDINKKVFKSADFGSTWEEAWNPFDIDKQRWAGEIMIIDQQSPQWLMVGGRDRESSSSVFLYNTEEDKWWAWDGSPSSNPTALLSHPQGNFLGFDNNGVYQNSLQDDSWIPKNQGLNDVEVIDVMPFPGDPGKIWTAIDGSLVITTDGGESWSTSGSYYTRMAVNPQDTSMIYAGRRSANLFSMSDFYYYKTGNGGASWERNKLFRLSGLWDYYYTLWMGDILVFPGDPDHILMGVDGGGGCGEGLYFSDDGGGSWDRKFSTGVSSIALDPTDHDIVYLGTSALGYVSRSEDGGKNWDMISPGGKEAFTGSVRDLGVDRDQQVFAATSTGLFRWEGGDNWGLVERVPEEDIHAIAVDNRTEISVLYAGTETYGVFVSRDGGESWEEFNNGLEKKSITRLEISETSPVYLYAGTLDGGTWRTMLPEVATGLADLKGTTDLITLYPNPTRGTFHIRSHAETPLAGTLRITDLSGQVVYSDPDLSVAPGHSIQIEAGHLPPGCYLIHFSNQQHTLTRKIMVN